MRAGAFSRRCDCRRREQKFDQRCISGNQTARRTERAHRICERSARVRQRGCEFRKAENESDVKDGDDQRGDQEADGAGCAPAIIPAEIFARNDEPDGKSP